jgi:hypothetical protein
VIAGDGPDQAPRKCDDADSKHTEGRANRPAARCIRPSNAVVALPVVSIVSMPARPSSGLVAQSTSRVAAWITSLLD